MKKTFLTLTVCAGMAMSAGAMESGDANIYASSLNVTENGVEFVLNATPTEVILNFYNSEGELVKSLPVQGVKGKNTVALDGLFDVAANTSLAWEVVAKAESNASVKLFSDESALSQMIAYPTHVAVDKNPKSAFFGRIYVNEAYAYTYTGRKTTMGVYVYDPLFGDVTGQGDKAWSGNAGWLSNGWTISSPCMLYVAENGDVFISDWSDDHSGVWKMNPAAPADDFMKVFGGTRGEGGLASANGVDIHGSVSGVCVVGDGADRVMYTYDEDLNGGGQISAYNIGNLDQAWVSAPTSAFYTNTSAKMVAGQSVVLRPDGRGGMWVSQHRYSDDAYPMLIHMNSNGEIDWDCNKTLTLINNYGMDVSADGKMVAIGASKTVKVWEVEYNENGVPSLTEKLTIAEKVSTKSFGVAFDAANNLYLADNSDHLRAFALPKEDNSYTTKANMAVVVKDTMTGVAEVAMDGLAPVEFYNLQGVKVENPQNGIFVKKQGGKTSKVVM